MVKTLREFVGGILIACGMWIAGATFNEIKAVAAIGKDALGAARTAPPAEAATPAPEPPKKPVFKPFRRTRSESQMAQDWETARNKDFQREARALMAEREAAKRRKEKRNGDDHKKR